MNVCLKTPLLVLAGCIIALTAHAQTTRQLIKPADATSGTATAGPSMIIPVMPSNLCTSTNNNCVTAASLPGQIAPLIPNQGEACTASLPSYNSGGYAPPEFGTHNQIVRKHYQSGDNDWGHNFQCHNGTWTLI